MSRRHHSPYQIMSHYRCTLEDEVILSREKAEQICQQKLRKVKKVKSKLCQTVLVRNTLKYVQNCTHDTFEHEEELKYEPVVKKLCTETSIFQSQVRKKQSKFDWKDCKLTRQDASEVSDDDSVVHGNETLKHPSDQEYLEELLRNRTNCTVTNSQWIASTGN